MFGLDFFFFFFFLGGGGGGGGGGISKDNWNSHKISYPYIERCDFADMLKF